MSATGASGAPASSSPAAPLDPVGLASATAAYSIWGFLPLYLLTLAPASPLEIVFHRALWALPTMALALMLAGRLVSSVRGAMKPRTLGVLALTALLISANWTLFVIAVQAGRVLEASLAYFINPLMSMALGVVLLRERMSIAVKVAIVLASMGVINQAIVVGEPPIFALALALCFALYGYFRKTVAVEAGAGLLIETVMIAPFALGAIVWIEAAGAGNALGDPRLFALLMLGGPLTALPLFLFATGARRLPLFVIGLLQFIAPSMQFVTALWLGEPFTFAHVVTFGFIWSGLAVMSADMIAKGRAARRAGVNRTAGGA